MKLKKIYLSIIPVLILYLILISSSCSENNPVVPPPVEPKVIFLKLATVSCTEAFITITANDTLLPVNITLNKDDIPLFNFTLSNKDTTIIDTTLQVNTTYIYQATAQINGETKKSDTLQAKTLNTTNHNFAWQTWTFGEYSSSVFYDVDIIDENNIWAVGEIYMNDSLGNPDPHRYNAIVWDGTNWEIKRIPYSYQGTDFFHPIQAIFAFEPNDIWFGGNGVIHWDGNQYNAVPIPLEVWGPHQINKIWGTSSSDLYIVGNDGKIAHYQNSNWSKIESGTDLPINDIWGIKINGQTKILAIASDKYQIRDKRILSIAANTVTEISNTGLPWSLSCIWFNNVYKTYAGGDGLYAKYNTQDYWNRIPLPLYYKFSIRGNRLNDIVVCGGLGYVGHFNGISWMNYLGNGLEEISGNYYSVNIKGNKICAVGIADGKAVAIIGTR